MDIGQILAQRAISEETASRLGWRESDGWLEMPVIQHGQEVGYKRRKFGEEKAFTQKKGTPQIFYNWDALEAAEQETLIITEGEVDCATALQCGYLAVSVPNGAPQEKIEEGVSKYKYLDDLPPKVVVILAFDADAAGNNLLHDVSLRIGRGRCKWLQYPKGCKDLNETLVKYGARGVHESVNRAKWMKVEGLARMSELPPVIELETVACKVSGMEDYYKLRLGDFTVITGIPSMGKTTFANEVAASMAKHGWNVAIGSFEQNPRADMQPWLQSYYYGRPAHLLNDKQREEANKWIDEKFVTITPTDEDIDLIWLMERIEAAALRHDCKLVIIDPWNELDHIPPAGMNTTDYTGVAIKQLKRLAARLRIHLIIITHPAKMLRNKDGEYPVPSLYDIADSAHWRNKADMGLIVHRDDENQSRIIVAKCRYWGKIGKIGEVKVKFDDYKNQFVAL